MPQKIPNILSAVGGMAFYDIKSNFMLHTGIIAKMPIKRNPIS